ncbi:hypothetical protein BJX61DRAFT_539219 [Aspergillus egyptiacus]|nr:hypothetical protein BJX61DRAFT_539219 [Aspergillus egyptiacus]
MEGSLRVDGYGNTQTSDTSLQHIDHCRNDISDRLEHDTRRATGARLTAPSRPITLDAASLPSVASADCREWQTKSAELNLKRPRSSDSKAQEAHGSAPSCASNVAVNEQTAIQQMPPGYTRPPEKASSIDHTMTPENNAFRQSVSVDSPRDSRIAALSAQLRSRLSYAAAKIEKKQQSNVIQSQSPTGFLQNNVSTSILSREYSGLRQPVSMGELDNQRLVMNCSPSTTVSAPDVPVPFSPYPVENKMRQSPIGIADGLRRFRTPQPDLQKHQGSALFKEYSYPRLAPPVDIVSNRVNGPRRRPNPNLPTSSSCTLFSVHGRHRSQQELPIDSDVILAPETPPLRSNTSVPYSRFPENSQSSSMEKDAIETLLFMSSPGTSGGHPNSQRSQHSQNAVNIETSSSKDLPRPGSLAGDQSNLRFSSQPGNLEIQAGDEIDLMLDQMDSDSDDDINHTLKRSIRAQSDSQSNDR